MINDSISENLIKNVDLYIKYFFETLYKSTYQIMRDNKKGSTVVLLKEETCAI